MNHLTVMIATMLILGTGTTFTQQAKPADESGRLVVRNTELQRRVCEMRTQYREDRTDDPECKNIPPSYEVLQLLHTACKQTQEKALCKNLLPLSMAVANEEEVFTFLLPVETTKKEALDFLFWAVGQMDLRLADNNHLPAKTRERMTWLFAMSLERQLTFFIQPTIVPEDTVNGSIFATSGYHDGKATISISAGNLASWFWENFQLKTPISRENRNSLAVSLSHEIIHLNHGIAALQAAESDLAFRIEEERKTWAANILEDIRPLQAKGEPVHPFHAKASAVLRSCNDNPDCPVFGKFIGESTYKK